MATEQENRIGEHPNGANVFAKWLQCNDIPCTVDIRHRCLVEVEDGRDAAIIEVAKWILKHHILDEKITEIKVKKRILSKYGFDDYFNSLSLLPLADKTRKGNLGEIVLSEYLSNTTQHELLVFRLRYNPNIEQSMKGDDVLMLNPNNMDEKIILGESKYRNPPGKDVVQEILDGMGSGTKSPISLTFIENVLRTQGKVSLAQAVAKMQAKINKGKIEIVNVGFLLSNHNGHNHINSHGKSSNPNLIFISANLNNPDDFISKCYEKAHEEIENFKAIQLHEIPIRYAGEIIYQQMAEAINNLKSILTF